jgi:hypothetical protein
METVDCVHRLVVEAATMPAVQACAQGPLFVTNDDTRQLYSAGGQKEPLRLLGISPDLALPMETAPDRGAPHPPHGQRMGA